MDILAAIAADPTLLPIWAVLLFAAGMYPVGMMFGCSPCCDPCICSSGESLPETITVTLNGFTDYSKRQICTLSFSACYGSGGSGTVDAPGQSAPESDPVDDRGPITAVSLTDGGSGYAKLGRAAPTVTVTGTSGSGTGATFNVTLASSKDSCGLDRWAVSKVERTGGTGYQTGDTLTFAIAEGDTQEVAAAATIGGTTYAEPTLTATAPGGTGGVLSINGYAKIVGGLFDGYYVPTGITVVSGGSGYTDNAQVTLSLGTDDEWAPGSGESNIRIRTILRPPADQWTLTPGATAPTGTGLVISMTFPASPEFDSLSGLWIFRAQSVSVVNGGSGYAVGQTVGPRAVEGDPTSTVGRAVVRITQVDAAGSVLSVAFGTGVLARGRYRLDTGVISSVVITSNRPARKAITEDVSVSNGGVYYREDASLPPYVATVTVNINQGDNTHNAGTGAVITATVEDDPQSPDFGVITGLAVQNGGDGYLAWMWETNDCCGHYLNGQSIVLTRFKDSNAAACQAATKDFLGQYNIPFSADGQYYSVPSDCVYTTQFCGGWVSPFLNGLSFYHQQQNSKLQLYVGYRGEGQRPVAKLGLHCYGGIGSDGGWLGCHQDWIADEPIESCSQFSFSATPPGRPSISVTPGGTYESDWRFAGCGDGGACPSCNVCCQGSDEPPEEIEIYWSDQWDGLSLPDYGQVIAPRPNNLADTSGTYVLQKSSATRWAGFFQHLAFDVGTTPGICGCVGDGCCEECIKKCSVRLFGMQIGTSYNTSQADNFLSDERFGSYGQYNFANCSVCNETPMCRPPPGLEIPIIVERIIVPLGFFFSRAGTITFQ